LSAQKITNACVRYDGKTGEERNLAYLKDTAVNNHVNGELSFVDMVVGRFILKKSKSYALAQFHFHNFDFPQIAFFSVDEFILETLTKNGPKQDEMFSY